MNKILKLQLDKKFRNKRQKINEIMNKENDIESEIKPLFDLLAQKLKIDFSIRGKKG